MQPQQSPKERGLLGRLCPGDKKLEGKTFYLDNVKKRSTTLLLEAISLLGGRVESFLHKDVTFVVTGSQESLKQEKSVVAKGEEKEISEGGQNLIKKPNSGLGKDKPQPVTPRPVCGSRGKALLEKAICNNERQQRSSVVSNARSWGVKILYADDVLLYLKHLTRESVCAKRKRPEKSSSKQTLPAVKATPLRAPYLKIEDINRKYKPLHMQSVAFPTLCFLGRFSPFEPPPPPLFEQHPGQGNKKKRAKKVKNSFQEKSLTLLSCSPSPWRPRKKDTSYCECCNETFPNLEEHLQSDKHRSFVLEPSNYKAVDQLVADMLPGFDPDPPEESEESKPPPLLVDDGCELELCSDVEVELAVQVFERDDSLLSSRVSNPVQSPPSCDQNLSSQRTDNRSLCTETHHQTSQVLSPTMPVLTIEPVDQQVETTCPDAPCLLPDPYSLPPVLSPQVPHSHNIIDPGSPYSEPPILSPQKFISGENLGAEVCETDREDSGSVLLLPNLLPAYLDGTSLEEEDGLNSLGVRKCPTSSLSRYSSFPRLSGVAPNPKKRSRSASPEQRSSKRKKTTQTGSEWCKQSLSPLKPPKDNLEDSVDCLLFSKASFPGRQPCPQTLFRQSSMFPSSAAQDFSPTLFQIDSSAVQPPYFLPSKATDCNFPDNYETQRSNFTRGAQRSQSLVASECIEPALIPDLAAHSSESSDSDWDCDLLSRLVPTSAAPPTAAEQSCELDKELLHRPCPWMRDSSYESHLHTVLQPSSPASSLCRGGGLCHFLQDCGAGC